MTPPNAPPMPTRRAALASLAAPALAGAGPGVGPKTAPGDDVEIGSQEYPWRTFAERAGEPWPPADLGPTLDAVEAAGCDDYEPGLTDPAELDALLPALKSRGLGIGSIYTNAVLHDPAVAEAETNRVLALVDRVRPEGCRVVVLNPTPIRWGGDEDKTDEQLRFQRDRLERLARGVGVRGLLLAYHFHDAEFRAGAREFHHMLAGTDPAFVRLCLDPHWAFRGCGDSAVAVHDAVRLYGARTAEVHLRNSAGGVWTEAFGPGDLDYAAIRDRLEGLGVTNFGRPGGPRLVLEQSVEPATPVTTTAARAHAAGRAHAARIFA